MKRRGKKSDTRAPDKKIFNFPLSNESVGAGKLSISRGAWVRDTEVSVSRKQQVKCQSAPIPQWAGSKAHLGSSYIVVSLHTFIFAAH